MTDGPAPVGAGEALASGFVVIGHLSRSGGLDVYDVWSEERACRCVAKVPRPDRIGDPKTESMLLAEGVLLQQLCHPHIVRCYEVLQAPVPVLILETLTGATLAHLVQSVTRIAVDDLAMLGLHLCSAIQYLHRRAGMLHLDLKPSNVIAEHGRAKILDFSIARAPGTGHRGVGTRQFLAPEQARGDLVTEATDVWGIGGVLFHAATGRTPFEAGEKGRYEQLERRAHSVRRYRRLPNAFTDLVDSCLDPDPARRPSIHQIAQALGHLVEGTVADTLTGSPTRRSA